MADNIPERGEPGMIIHCISLSMLLTLCSQLCFVTYSKLESSVCPFSTQFDCFQQTWQNIHFTVGALTLGYFVVHVQMKAYH